MTGFGQTFLGKEFATIEEFFSTEGAAILKALHPLIAAAEAAIEKNGLPLFEQAASTIATNAAAALSGGETKAVAANAAIAAAGDAAKALGEDVLKGLATAAVSTPNA